MAGFSEREAPRLARWVFGAWAAFACFSTAAVSPSAPPEVVVKRGLTGEIRFHHQGVPLRADPDQELSAPVLVRVEANSGDPHANHVVRFMGTLAGTYDLAEWVVGADGMPVPSLHPLIVQVISDLPAGQGTSLYEIADPPISIRGGYRKLGGLLILLWCLVPAVTLMRRWLRPRESVDSVPVEPAPTLADQLRPLAVRAREHTLTVAEQGRLELLLVFFWRERLGRPASSIPDVLPLLREHPEAGPLLSAVERWLHHPGDSGWESSSLDRLMEPYRRAPAVSDAELAGVVAGGDVP